MCIYLRVKNLLLDSYLRLQSHITLFYNNYIYICIYLYMYMSLSLSPYEVLRSEGERSVTQKRAQVVYKSWETFDEKDHRKAIEKKKKRKNRWTMANFRAFSPRLCPWKYVWASGHPSLSTIVFYLLAIIICLSLSFIYY